jgi:glycosyltransferase involved in cell wall biosynthesis
MNVDRILLITSTLAPGGAERVMATMANYWAERGKQVSLLTIASTRDDFYSLHPAVERVALDLLWDSDHMLGTLISNCRRLARIRREVVLRKPQVVLSFIDQTNVRVLAALLWTRAPIIVSERTDPRHHMISKPWRALRRLLYRRARRVIVQTVSVQAWASKFVSAKKIAVIPNPVRNLPFPQRNGKEQRTILGIGRLIAAKGFDLLLPAFALSGLQHHGWRLTLLGEGSERVKLGAMAKQLGISQVLDMPGIVRSPESYMAESEIFVLASRYEGFPNALLEAMAMGMAVVSVDCDSGPREIIHNQVDGLLVPTKNVEELATALRHLGNDKDLRMKLGSRATEVRQRFDLSKIMRQWEEIIDQACCPS